MALTEVIDREFTADQAGQRVGWLETGYEVRDDAENLVWFQAAIATVGEAGAVVTHLQDGERSLHSLDSVRGFEAATSIGGVILKESGIKDSSQIRVLSSGRQKFIPDGVSPNELFVRGVESRVGKYDHVELVDSGQELLDAIKAHFLESGEFPAGTYDHLYYLLNHGMAHEDLKPNDVRESKIGDWVIADSTMQQTTAIELAYATQINAQLAGQFDEGQAVIKEIDDLSRDDIMRRMPEVFTASRRKVGELERSLIEVSNRMIVSGVVYMPTGFRPEGRTWPYMDAAVTDERQAYGVELNSLMNGDRRTATRALESEAKELQLRRDYARKGWTALQLIANKELEAA